MKLVTITSAHLTKQELNSLPVGTLVHRFVSLFPDQTFYYSGLTFVLREKTLSRTSLPRLIFKQVRTPLASYKRLTLNHTVSENGTVTSYPSNHLTCERYVLVTEENKNIKYRG